jgi:hypothetical protein
MCLHKNMTHLETEREFRQFYDQHENQWIKTNPGEYVLLERANTPHKKTNFTFFRDERTMRAYQSPSRSKVSAGKISFVRQIPEKEKTEKTEFDRFTESALAMFKR